jgi:predicted nucleotidyltransferase component of viral defense system
MNKTRNVAASVRQRLLNYSTTLKADPNLVLIWYGIERLLYRLSLSPHRDKFVLKGAMLFRVWSGQNFRATKDLDLLGLVREEAEPLRQIFVSICEQDVEDDGLVFDASNVQISEIRDDQEYGGFRLSLSAKLGTARVPVQVDVGIGDAITPAPQTTDFPTMLNQPQPHIRIYPRETVVAEKVDAIVQLGMANSRMKDYYDLWFMSRRFEFAGSVLASAIRATFTRRETAIPTSMPIGLTGEYGKDASHARQWAAFNKRIGTDAPSALETVVETVAAFVLPPVLAVSSSGAFDRVWVPQSGWQQTGKS